MPNSSGGQQEVEQQEEEVEVGEVEEGAREPEFWQQDEVVKRRITVSRRPIRCRMKPISRLISCRVVEPVAQYVPVKAYTITVRREKRVLR